ncbi:hypothetical protein ACFWWU_36400 [Streptomyces sp. NPDC058650]|uniref:hypothetical protein n=1 Tax=Streptomyces sp. NPDC058650 TaxID=3346575 RepID=UPI00365B677F
MVWQKIDDQFGVSQKVIRIPRKRRQQIVGLWALAGNYAVRALTDGVLEEHELDELDARRTDVDELVRVELMHRHGFPCDSEYCTPAPEGGVTLHDFLRYNPSKAEVEAGREAERVRKAAYRESKRRPAGTDSGTPAGSDAASEHPVPVPSRPVPMTDLTPATESSPEVDASVSTDSGDLSPAVRALAAQAGITSVAAIVEQIRKWTQREVAPEVAVGIARHLLSKAKGEPRAPQRYVFRAISQSPLEVQQFIDEAGLAA